jgi:hypothetical protein
MVSLTRISKNRSGYDELPDFTRLKDSKGNLIFCSHCGGSSLSKQQIIACDYCSCQFHLDCLDPPQANPPPLRDDGKRSLWMCPRHIDHDLKTIDPRQHTAVRGRIHRIRKPRIPKVKDVSLRRGFRNNGLIEIENEATDTESEFYEDESASGTVYRLPERGVILDFIYKVKEYALHLIHCLRRILTKAVGQKCDNRSTGALNQWACLHQHLSSNSKIALLPNRGQL